MAADDPRRDVDALREKLRTLGYLDAGVDRFVLGSVRQRYGHVRNTLRASFRIGLLAGALLGPAAAVGLAVRVPELVTGTRDALVVAGYLFVLFGGAAAAMAFCAAALVTIVLVRVRPSERLPGLARQAARVAGSMVATLCLAYLTLWWRGVALQANLASTWTATVLLVAIAISFVLGRAVTATALAILAHANPTAFGAPRHGVARAVPLVLAVVAFAGAAGLLVATSTRATTDTTPARLVVVPTGLRLVVVGIDGFDPTLAERLAAEGRVPTLARWLSGARAHAPRDTANDPVRAWTTIATGLPPSAHGVAGLETRAVAGLGGRVAAAGEITRALAAVTDLLRLTRPRLSSSSERQALAFWEVAARAGLKTAVVNWWSTWPARESDGAVITERALLRLARGGQGRRGIVPAELDARLVGAWPALHAGVERDVEPTSQPAAEPFGDLVRRSAELDLSVVALAAETAKDAVDLLVVYLPGLDILQTALLGEPGTQTPASLAQRLDAISTYCGRLDRALASLVKNGATHIVLVGYPGRLGRDAPAIISVSRTDEGDRAVPHQVTSALSARETPHRLEDVAPTVLAALGVPLSQELAGVPFLDGLAAALPRIDPRTVPSYGRRVLTAGAESTQGPLDDEMRERLRSLGYVR